MKPNVARTQYRLSPADLALVLALARSGTLTAAGVRLGVDPSTVFRALQRLERALGVTLFDRGRAGSSPTETALQLVRHAERIELELEAARASTRTADAPLEGVVRITSTDVILKYFVMPALVALARQHPTLQFELSPGYEVANLTKRDADIALRATKTPPPHLVGQPLGRIPQAVFGSAADARKHRADMRMKAGRWIGLDDAVPNHAATRWRKRHCPDAVLVLEAGSIELVRDGIEAGLGIGILPVFMAHGRELVQLSPNLDACETALWLLMHPASRHIGRVSAVFKGLAEGIVLR